jgi:hypothetical protein
MGGESRPFAFGNMVRTDLAGDLRLGVRRLHLFAGAAEAALPGAE